jgi:RNA polymerase sigma-70 factor (ECF subfamily)
LAGATSELEPGQLDRLRAGLKIMALRALGDPEAAEEAAQETLTRTVEAVREGRLEEPEKLGAFVRGIARHVIADVHRARQRMAGFEALPESDPGSLAADPLSALISKEEREHVRRALADLSAADREILHLSFFEGLTPAQIAQRLGEPAQRIRKRKSRALERLRRAFPQEAEPGHE